MPEDLREATKLTANEFIDLCNKILKMNKEEILGIIKAPNTSALELLVASIIQKGVVEGDQRRLEFILDRLIGKITQQLNLSGSVSQPQIILNLPDNGRAAKS